MGNQPGGSQVPMGDRCPTILVCLFGGFRVLKAGREVAVRGANGETLLCFLATHHGYPVSREALVLALWPEIEDAQRAFRSLNSLIYSLNRLLGEDVGPSMPILRLDDKCQLNFTAGVGVDVVLFTNLFKTGQQLAQAGDRDRAAAAYTQAIELYRGDLYTCNGADVQTTLERECMRTHYLTMLSFVAESHFEAEKYTTSLEYARRILQQEPCREDAHRLIMRCFVRRGERAQALRQYRLCEEILRLEWQAVPEPETKALFNLIRLDPGRV